MKQLRDYYEYAARIEKLSTKELFVLKRQLSNKKRLDEDAAQKYRAVSKELERRFFQDT